MEMEMDYPNGPSQDENILEISKCILKDMNEKYICRSVDDVGDLVAWKVAQYNEDKYEENKGEEEQKAMHYEKQEGENDYYMESFPYQRQRNVYWEDERQQSYEEAVQGELADYQILRKHMQHVFTHQISQSEKRKIPSCQEKEETKEMEKDIEKECAHCFLKNDCHNTINSSSQTSRNYSVICRETGSCTDSEMHQAPVQVKKTENGKMHVQCKDVFASQNKNQFKDVKENPLCKTPNHQEPKSIVPISPTTTIYSLFTNNQHSHEVNGSHIDDKHLHNMEWKHDKINRPIWSSNQEEEGKSLLRIVIPEQMCLDKEQESINRELSLNILGNNRDSDNSTTGTLTPEQQSISDYHITELDLSNFNLSNLSRSLS